jgi:glycosyltransferase involved in cell wall biosynthesis
MRLGVLTTHPVQYHAPLFRALARRPGVELEVMFCHDHGLKPSFDAGFRKTIRFDVPLVDGYKHRFLHSFPRRPGVHQLAFAPEVLPPLWTGRFDAIVVFGYATLTNLVALVAPRRRPRILLRGDSSVRKSRSPLRCAMKRAVLPRLFRHVDQFLSIGSLNADYYRSYGVPSARITLAPFTVDNHYFELLAARTRAAQVAIRSDLGLPRASTVFLFAGKLIGQKRPLDVLRAFAAVSSIRERALIFAGDGELMEQARREAARLQIDSQTRFLGFQNQSELASLYGACDVLVLPSGTEPWGLVVNEAMAGGMCAVVSDQVGAGPDLVPDPALVFPAGDVGRLARILSRLCEDAEWLAFQKREASSRIASWDIENTVDGILAGVGTALERQASSSSDSTSTRWPSR